MIHDVIRVSAALITLTAFGYALTVLVARNVAFCWFERFGLGYVLGIGAGSILWVVLTPAYAIVSPIVLISAVAWTTTAIALWRRLRLAPPDDGPTFALRAAAGKRSTMDPPSRCALWRAGDRRSTMDDHRWAKMVLSLLLAIQLVALTAAALRSGLGFDAVFNFEIKARLAFENATPGRIPMAYFDDESLAWSHPRYPLLVPFAEYWVYAWLGRIDQAFAKVVFPLYYAALVCVMGGALQRAAGCIAALCAVVALGTLPAITVIPGAASGYAEIPLAAALTGALCCALIAVSGLPTEARSAKVGRPMFWMAGLLSATAAWTKAEGVVLSICLAIATAALAGRKALPLLVMPLAVIVPWLAFQYVYGVPERDFPSLSPLVALSHLDRVTTIARLAARELATPGHWGTLWPAFAILWLAGLPDGMRDAASFVLATLVIIPLCIYPAMYLFSSWSDVEGHLRTSFIRLLVPIAPAALMFSAVRLKRALS